jgi:hypothetical protein
MHIDDAVRWKMPFELGVSPLQRSDHLSSAFCGGRLDSGGAWLNFSFLAHFPHLGSIQLIAQTLLRQHFQG